MKKFLALALAIIMVLALGVPALAAGEGTITIKNSEEGTVYDFYKILELTGSSTDTDPEYEAVSYTIASKWENFFRALKRARLIWLLSRMLLPHRSPR